MMNSLRMNKKAIWQLYIAEFVIGIILIIAAVLIIMAATSSQFSKALEQSTQDRMAYKTTQTLRTFSQTPFENYDSIAFALNRYFELSVKEELTQEESREKVDLETNLKTFGESLETVFAEPLFVGETYGVEAELYLGDESKEKISLSIFQGRTSHRLSSTTLEEPIFIQLPVYFSSSQSSDYHIRLQVRS